MAMESQSPHPRGDLPAICTFGRYELLGRLAVGGMAEIYLAREPVTGGASRRLVIKRILSHVASDPQFETLFFNEARVAMGLRHPNICHIYEFGEIDGSCFIAMEWVDGVPLGKLIRRSNELGGLPVAVAAKIASQVAEALHYAHRAKSDDGSPLGIVHRDVSPQNVMVSFDGAVKLLDFGVAKAADEHHRTTGAQVKGKFAYMAPEQCLGEAVDGRADVFSLGVCLYEALTGRHLYRRKTQYETMRAVLEEPVASPRKVREEVPQLLDSIVHRALAKDAGERFQTAGEMQEALEQWLASERQVVHAGRIASLLERLFADEIATGPSVDSSQHVVEALSRDVSPPEGAEQGGRGAGTATTQPEARSSGSDRSRLALLLAVPVVLGLLIGAVAVGAWWLGRSSGGQAATGEVPAASAGHGSSTEPAPPLPPLPDPEQGEGDQATAGDEPAEAAEAAAERGGPVAVSSQPPGAIVRLDGERVEGRTPLELEGLGPGTYRVAISRRGYRTWRDEIRVQAGEPPPDVQATLAERETAAAAAEPEPAPAGRLSINTRPWSKVYLGGELLGTTPIGKAKVPSGWQRLRIVDRDGQTHHRKVEIAPGEETSVSYVFGEDEAP